MPKVTPPEWSKKAKGMIVKNQILESLNNYVWDSKFFSSIVIYALDWQYASTKKNLVEWANANCDLPEELKTYFAPLKDLNKLDSTALQCLEFINDKIDYTPDMKTWKVGEKWQTPAETWKLKKGDCEDGAILLYAIMKYVGFTDAQMWIVAGDVWDGKGSIATDKYIKAVGINSYGDMLCQKELKDFKKGILNGTIQYQKARKLNKDNESLLIQSLNKVLSHQIKENVVQIIVEKVCGNFLKIDPEFVKDVERINNSASIIKTKIDLTMQKQIFKYYAVLVMENTTIQKIRDLLRNNIKKTSGTAGHCYLVYQADNLCEYPLDWCYDFDTSIMMEIVYDNRSDYYYGDREWFRFNCSGCFKEVNIMTNETSAKFSLNNNDWKKIGKGAAVAGAGAVLTYAVAVIPNLDFGNPGITPVVCAVLSIVVNAALKYVQGQSPK